MIYKNFQNKLIAFCLNIICHYLGLTNFYWIEVNCNSN
uniref:Uncharacterized protein n=1 Tax=Rhizophora mucronata TaxID=61149 RepID=A0A2P2QT67_RHIMU